MNFSSDFDWHDWTVTELQSNTGVNRPLVHKRAPISCIRKNVCHSITFKRIWFPLLETLSSVLPSRRRRCAHRPFDECRGFKADVQSFSAQDPVLYYSTFYPSLTLPQFSYSILGAWGLHSLVLLSAYSMRHGCQLCAKWLCNTDDDVQRRIEEWAVGVCEPADRMINSIICQSIWK